MSLEPCGSTKGELCLQNLGKSRMLGHKSLGNGDIAFPAGMLAVSGAPH